jgi:hypothetical protein
MKYLLALMLLTTAVHACVTGPKKDGTYTIDRSGCAE